MATTLNWGIIGAGGIAKTFAKGLANSKTGKLLAVASRSQEKADKFGQELNVPRRYGSYEALLADKDVQAVYIATPHPMHAEWAIKAAEAGKHILCEKPIALNHAEAMTIVEAAVANDVFLMEAFMYRCHPQIAKLVELIREKAIGEVRIIQATFSFHAGFNPESRLWKNDLAGGGIMDVGCYATSMARLVAGAAMGKDFADPISVSGAGRLSPQTHVDEYAVGVLKFPGDIVATIATGVGLNQDNTVRIFGTEGNIVIPSAWIPAREGGTVRIIVKKNSEKEPREIVIENKDWLYAMEADAVAANLDKRQAPSPAMSWGDTLGNMQTLDQWRQAIGLVYDAEKPENYTHTISRRPLAVRKDHKMKYGQIAHLDKQVSRLIMGVDNQPTMAHAAAMFDDWFTRGGNAFDTAWVYGRPRSELLGQWVKNRGVREQVVIISKGAHTPQCNPTDLTKQLKEQLGWLKTDYADIYMMHRDNLEIPVGEFIDVLNEHVKAGRIKAFGGSNWSLARVQEANDYATKKGLQGFSVVSNNFSLARMIEPVWSGCIAASDPESRAWFKKTQIPLLSWSSQARGFFTDRAAPDKKEDKSLVTCWYSDDNFRRKQRVDEMAEKRGLVPISIALAYVLCQPFPTFPLIGPRLLSETRTSLPALDIELSPKDLKWLNLED